MSTITKEETTRRRLAVCDFCRVSWGGLLQLPRMANTLAGCVEDPRQLHACLGCFLKITRESVFIENKGVDDPY